MKTSWRRLLVVSAVLAVSAGAARPTAADTKKPAARAVVGGKRVVKTGGDSRAWNTLKPLLSEGATVVGQVNVAALRGSDTFGQLRRLVQRDGNARDFLEAARSGCQLELADVVQDVAFALSQQPGRGALFAVSLKGVNEADLVSCAEAAAAKAGGTGAGAAAGKKLEVKRSGGISEYTYAGASEHMYAAWLASDVVAFTSDPGDRSRLAAYLGGKGGLVSAPANRRAFAAVVPGATAWLVYLETEKLDAYELKLAAASLTVSGGQLSFDVSLVLADADSARRAAADWAVQRDQLAAGGGSIPALLGQLIKAVQIAAADDVVRVTASVSEKDFFGSFPLF
jgi:hypothetical protein